MNRFTFTKTRANEPIHIHENSSYDTYDDGHHDGQVELAKEIIDLLKSEQAWPL